MNNQSGTLEGVGASAPFDRRELTSATGLRDVIVAESGPAEQRITPS